MAFCLLLSFSVGMEKEQGCVKAQEKSTMKP